MNNTAIIPHQASTHELAHNLPHMREMAEVFLKARIVNSQLDTLEKIMAVMFKANELGVSQTYALEKMSVISGHVNMEAELMLALIYQSGCCAGIDIKEGADACSVTMQRTTPRVKHAVSYSLEDAKRAGLLGKDNWQKYPRNMLRWRAVSECAKIVFPDVLGGMMRSEAVLFEPQGGITDAVHTEIEEAETVPLPVEPEPAPAQPVSETRPFQEKMLLQRLREYADRLPREHENLPELREKLTTAFAMLSSKETVIEECCVKVFGHWLRELDYGEIKAFLRWMEPKQPGNQLSHYVYTEFAALTGRSAEDELFDGDVDEETGEVLESEAVYDAIRE